MIRVVKDELLDEMDVNDPEAVRSRRDLRFINRFMGGERWVCSELVKLHQVQELKHVVEIGAGEGRLSERIKAALPEVRVSGLDRIPRPAGLSDAVEWLQEDVMDLSVVMDESVAVVANLFVHHFEADELVALFKKLRGAGVLLFAEPYRSLGSKVLGSAIYPLVNRVTRYDMMVSIEAGFLQGELSDLLDEGWRVEEQKSLLGGLRVKGVKK